MNRFTRIVLFTSLAIAFLWTFFPGLRYLYQTYTSFWLIDNTYALCALSIICGVLAYRHGFRSKKNEISSSHLICASICLACLLLILNRIFGGFEIIPGIAIYIGVYGLLGFLLTPSFWRRGFPMVGLFIATLPILERLQKFVGFPLRTFTATVVHFLLQLVGAGNVSYSTIIITENYATTIDLPCSGLNSLYFGTVIFIAVAWWLRLKLNFQTILLALGFFCLLIVCNIWRVFSLVYVYGILHLTSSGDSIHIALGVIGFAVSCIALWYGAEWIKKRDTDQPSREHIPSSSPISSQTALILCITVVCITGVITRVLFPLQNQPSVAIQSESTQFVLPNTQVSLIPFSEKEKTLFLNKDVTFASKYSLNIDEKKLSLLLVKSASARSYHDPELCLQGLGYIILSNHSVPLTKSAIQKLTLQTASDPGSQRGWVYYWYVSHDTVITDYSARVWNQVQHPGTPWVLVEIAGFEHDEPSEQEREKLFEEVTSEVRKQLL